MHAGGAILFAACCTLASLVAADDNDVSLLQTRLHLHAGQSPDELLFAFQADTTVDERPVLAAMAAAPMDLHTQLSGCRSLGSVIVKRGDAVMHPEVIEPVLVAVKNHVADRVLVKTCFAALSAFRATFNRTRTLAINRGTHIAEAVAAVLRQYPHDHDMLKDALIYVAAFSTFVACEVQPPFVDTGCIDMVWDALDYFTGRENSDVQMSAWQGFSDHTGCKYGANAVANHRGKPTIKRIVQTLQENIGNAFHPDNQHGGEVITLQYEIMTVANGVLIEADDTLDAFVQAGYGPTVLSSMRDQPDIRSTHERGCMAIVELLKSEAARAALEADGVLELLAVTMERFKGKDHRVFVNAELGDFYPVLPSCDLALRMYATNSTAVQDNLLRLGVLETYETMRQDLLEHNPSMAVLPKLLRARRAQHEGDF